jgi:hypothetical protein
MDDLVAELGKITKSNATFSSGPYSNVTTAAWDDWPSFPDMTGRYAIDMLIGKEPTHMGSMKGIRLYNEVYQKLRSCGIAHQNPSVPGFCNFERPECYRYCAFGPIGYRDGKNGYKTDSTVRITTKYSYFEEENNPGIQDLTVSQTGLVGIVSSANLTVSHDGKSHPSRNRGAKQLPHVRFRRL